MSYNAHIKKHILFCTLIITLTLAGCREKIDIKLKYTYVRLVIDGTLTNEAKRHAVKITQTSNFFSDEPQPLVTGAKVSISDGISTETLTETSPGIYQTGLTYKGEIGRTYILNIKYDGEEYSASSLLKYVSPIDSINFQPVAGNPDKYEIKLYAQEPPTNGDYYLWRNYRNGVLETDSLNKVTIVSDELVNGQYLPGIPVYALDAKPGDTITLEMRSITKDYYDFVLAFYKEVFAAGTPFSGPPSNVLGNVKNLTNERKEVMGFFVASAVSKKTRVIK